jgi:hypothetical protein
MVLIARATLASTAGQIDCAASRSHILEVDRQFYDDAANSSNATLNELLGGACRAFNVNHYKTHEFALALHSLHQMIAKPRIPAPQKWSNPLTLLGPSDSEPLVLYLDITCDHCRMALELVVEAQKRSHSFPPIDFRLLPGLSNVTAVSGSAVLMALREQHPEDYVDGVMLFARVLPGDSNALPALTAQYAPLDAKRAARARQLIAAERRRWSQTPPFALYRGRILQRPVNFGFDDVPFDPFSDPELLILAVRLLDVLR